MDVMHALFLAEYPNGTEQHSFAEVLLHWETVKMIHMNSSWEDFKSFLARSQHFRHAFPNQGFGETMFKRLVSCLKLRSVQVDVNLKKVGVLAFNSSLTHVLLRMRNGRFVTPTRGVVKNEGILNSASKAFRDTTTDKVSKEVRTKLGHECFLDIPDVRCYLALGVDARLPVPQVPVEDLGGLNINDPIPPGITNPELRLLWQAVRGRFTIPPDLQ